MLSGLFRRVLIRYQADRGAIATELLSA